MKTYVPVYYNKNDEQREKIVTSLAIFGLFFETWSKGGGAN